MENLTPKTRLEKYLAKIAGQDLIVPEPKTRFEYWLNKIAESGGGSSDFSTATVTLTTTDNSSSFYGCAIVDDEITPANIELDPVEEPTVTAVFVLYKGSVMISGQFDFETAPVITGDIIYDTETYSFIILGNGTITVRGGVGPK